MSFLLPLSICETYCTLSFQYAIYLLFTPFWQIRRTALTLSQALRRFTIWMGNERWRNVNGPLKTGAFSSFRTFTTRIPLSSNSSHSSALLLIRFSCLQKTEGFGLRPRKGKSGLPILKTTIIRQLLSSGHRLRVSWRT